MEIKVIQLWGADYQPWQASSYPWNTVNFNESLVISQPASTVQYGAKIMADVESLVISNSASTVKYGIKILASVESLVLNQIKPSLKYGIKFIADVETLTLNQIASSVKYGVKIMASVEKLVLSTVQPTLRYGIKYLAEVSNLVINQITPQKFGALWERIAGIATNWDKINKINKGSSIWESYGTILWSWRNSPWLSTYQPWLEKGGAKPVTNYEGTPDVTTNYLGGNKPTTIIYDNINKPNN